MNEVKKLTKVIFYIHSCTESDCGGPRTRRSSIVVIPPMQICPGDLLVYSKVLTQRSNHLGS